MNALLILIYRQLRVGKGRSAKRGESISEKKKRKIQFKGKNTQEWKTSLEFRYSEDNKNDNEWWMISQMSKIV